jgi:hypothetical protein
MEYAEFASLRYFLFLQEQRSLCFDLFKFLNKQSSLCFDLSNEWNKQSLIHFNLLILEKSEVASLQSF